MIEAHHEITNDNNLAIWRVSIFTVLSCGLYLFYWFYITWKQVQISNKREDYHPVWHALALLAPIYNLFLVYRHMKTIMELQAERRVQTTISPGWMVFLFWLSSVLDYNLFKLTSRYNVGIEVSVMVGFVSVFLTAGVLTWAQVNINRYWMSLGAGRSNETRIGTGEVILVIIGMLLWLAYFL